MLMVIFGAGASYDSSSTYTPGMVPPGATQTDRDNDFNRPPLAKDLFANRPLFIEAVDAFPQCKTIVHKLRDPAVTSGQASIEARLQEIEEQAQTYLQAQQELAAVRCYLQRAITQCEVRWRNNTRKITNHLALLREIQRTHKTETDEPVCLVTFNYDTLLEDALADLGLEIKHMDDYTRRPVLFRLFKLHGSVNWGHVLENRFPSTELQPSDQFVLCDPSTMRSPDIGHTLFPAIAIPVQKKSIFECPQPMLEEFVSVLREVRKILVVGWRATEEHFLALLGNRLTGLRPRVELYIVAGPDQQQGEEIGVRICRALLNNPPQSPTVDGGGFTDFIRSPRVQQFLTR
ncbi:MAG TPA: SIR2 family protein [Candidatus Angelobacter sp.]|nr:SIR2 family protein [Candidatus Angelobacter sp.]